VLPTTSGALYLLQRLRDEAHRFAIMYHRQVRAKAATRSALDDLPGVGPARKRALLRVFGSSRGLKGASVEEIAAVPGIGHGLAERIRSHLDS
jgi:excinuclease ABC subunit C